MRNTRGYINVMLIGFAVCLNVKQVRCQTFRPLGCFQDDILIRDLNRKEVSLEKLDLKTCTESCIQDGHPYTGLQNGKLCFCGDVYGKYGRSGRCNITCNPLPCGGPMQNYVYYSLDVNYETRSQREDVVHQEGRSWNVARENCIKNNGDLVSVITMGGMSEIVDKVSTVGINGSRFWIGLWKRHSDYDFEWTNILKTSYISNAYTSFWKSGESFSESCVSISTESKKFETTPCTEELPFVCKQIPDKPTEPPPTASDSFPTTTVPGWSKTQKKVFYVILPLFLFVYLGSCVYYVIYKLLKSRRQKRQSRLPAQSSFKQFEADTQALQDDSKSETEESPPLKIRLSSYPWGDYQTPGPSTSHGFTPYTFLDGHSPCPSHAKRLPNYYSRAFKSPGPSAAEDSLDGTEVVHKETDISGTATPRTISIMSSGTTNTPDQRKKDPTSVFQKAMENARQMIRENNFSPVLQSPIGENKARETKLHSKDNSSPDNLSVLSIQEILQLKLMAQNRPTQKVKKILQV